MKTTFTNGCFKPYTPLTNQSQQQPNSNSIKINDNSTPDVNNYRESKLIQSSTEHDSSDNASHNISKNCGSKQQTQNLHNQNYNDYFESDNSDDETDDFDMEHHKRTISQINKCTTDHNNLKHRFENQVAESRLIIAKLKQVMNHMENLSKNLQHNTGNTNHHQNKNSRTTHASIQSISTEPLNDNIDEILNPREITNQTTEVKEITIFKLSATELDALQSTTTPLNIPKFKELRDKYEACLNQIRTFLMQVESMRGKYLDKDLQNTINEIRDAIKKLKGKEIELESELNNLI